MSAAVKVESEFLSLIEVLLFEFSGDERSGAVGQQFGDGRLSAAGENPDPLQAFRSEFDGGDFGEELFQPNSQVISVQMAICQDADGIALVVNKAAGGVESEFGGKEGIVSDFRMKVQGEVGAVYGEVSVQADLELLPYGPGEGLGWVPEQSVMDDEKINAGGNRLFKGNQSGVNSCTDAGDLSVVFNLEPVAGSGEISYRSKPCPFVTIMHNFLQGGHGERVLERKPVTGNRELAG